jgi:hypothetical protein
MATITKFSCSANLEYVSFVFNTVRYTFKSPVSEDDYKREFITHKFMTLNELMKRKCGKFMFSSDYVFTDVDGENVSLLRLYAFVPLDNEPAVRYALINGVVNTSKDTPKDTQKDTQKDTPNNLMAPLCLLYAELFKDTAYNKNYYDLLKRVNITIPDLFNFLATETEIPRDKCDYIMCLMLSDRVECFNNSGLMWEPSTGVSNNTGRRWSLNLSNLQIDTKIRIAKFYAWIIAYNTELIYDCEFMREYSQLGELMHIKDSCELARIVLREKIDVNRYLGGLATLLNLAEF